MCPLPRAGDGGRRPGEGSSIDSSSALRAPSPRLRGEKALTGTVLSSGAFDDHGDALAAADARAGEAVALLAAPQFVQKCQHESRSGRCERMAERDRAVVHVQLLLVDTKLF